ncbi:MAG: ornithine monooxygenase [Burkholderiales bacterium]|jgi:L-ornithine N5-oxygenase|nr:ornithine monooxygenase [Burkholderiales bacterium]
MTQLSKNSKVKKYDILGIGFGPANLALAIALDGSLKKMKCKFLESSPNGIWQEQMLIDGSDIQNVPHRDLITPVNPMSKFTFINYLVEHNKFFDYMNLMVLYPLRKEYAKYIKWCADHFSQYVSYNTKATKISVKHCANKQSYYEVTANTGEVYLTRSLVIGTGRVPYIPKQFAALSSSRLCHLTQYLTYIDKLSAQKEQCLNIAVIGGSQSAAEILLDLNKTFPNAKIHSFIRKFSFKLKDVSPFSYEMINPDFTEYYFNRTHEEQLEIRSHLHTANYSSVDADVLNKLYMELYEQELDGNQRLFIHKNTQIETAVEVCESHQIKLVYVEKYTKEKNAELFDLVILATGFKDMGIKENQEKYPPILQHVVNNFEFHKVGFLAVKADYSLAAKSEHVASIPLYLNGLCETSHGLGDAGSLSLLSLRAKAIKNSILKYLDKKN